MRHSYYPYWAEVSGYIEKWFGENGGQPVPHSEALPLLGKSSDIKELSDDGYHYVRLLSDGDTIAECVYCFKDASLMDKLNTKLVNRARGFCSYGEYCDYIAANEKRKQDELKYLEFKHVSPKEAWAIGFVTTLDEYNDYSNLNELTPYFYQAFMDAIETLRQNDNKTWLNVGEILKKYVTPITSNVFEKYNENINRDKHGIKN